MGTLTSAIATAALLIPAERHIDLSGWPGATTVQFDVRVTAMDGTTYETTIELASGATVSQARNLLWGCLERNGWRGRTVGKGIIVLEGSRKSAIRSVQFTSKDWKPDVRLVPLMPEKKK